MASGEDATSVHLSPHVFAAPKRTIQRREGVLNLSSNELLHADVASFWSEFLRAADPRMLSAYPLYDRTIAAASRELETSPDRVLLTAGSDDAIRLIAEALMTTTGRAILVVPNYEGWEHHATMRRVAVTRVSLHGGGDERLSTLLRAVAVAEPSIVVLASPGVGIGPAYTQAELSALSRAASRRGHVLVVDECYLPFAEEGAGRAPDEPHVLVVRSFSKSFGLAGARIGAIRGSRRLIDYLARYRPENPVSGIALAALTRALAARAVFERVWADVRENRAWLAERVREARVGLVPLVSSGNFIHLRVGSNGAAADLASLLLDAHIRVRDASSQEGLEGTIRATIGDRPVTKALLHALVEPRAAAIRR